MALLFLSYYFVYYIFNISCCIVIYTVLFRTGSGFTLIMMRRRAVNISGRNLILKTILFGEGITGRDKGITGRD